MVDQAVIEEAGRRLARAAGESAQVMLFGSHARGDADARSYVDAWRNVRGSIVHSAFGDGRVLAG